jgi:TetR/AcrR family transcriptional regulator
MYKQTIKNLTKERQEEILLKAFEEFSLNGYKSASLSAIIKKLELAKGSFYRYFSSKKELFKYLIEEGFNRRLKTLDDLIKNESNDFFDLIKQNFINKINFDIENPVIGAFLYQIMHDKENSEVADIIKNIYQDIILRTKQIILLDKFKNQIASEDVELIAFHVFQMQLWLYDYVAYKYNIDFQENIRNHKPVFNLPQHELTTIVDKSISILKNGIKKINP